MNFDFVAMNLTGFLFYSIYNTYGYFIDDSQTGKVDLNDIFFAYHAMFATLLTITQICIYPKKDNRVHSYTVALLVSMWIFAGVYTTLILVFFALYLGDKNLRC
jgi:cystinosin